MSAVGVGHAEPAQAGRELAILLWPQHQVPVVGYQTPRQQACVRARYRLEEQVLKVGIVLIAVKDLQAAIGAIEDMIDLTAKTGSRGSGHE